MPNVIRLAALSAAGLLLAPAPAGACDFQASHIFFAPGSARIAESERPGIRAQAQLVAAMGERAWIRLTAHSDRAGRGWANLDLSRRRAEAVRDALAALGVPHSQVEIIARGEAGIPVPTPDDRAEPRNRVVTVTAFAADQREREEPVPGCAGFSG